MPTQKPISARLDEARGFRFNEHLVHALLCPAPYSPNSDPESCHHRLQSERRVRLSLSFRRRRHKKKKKCFSPCPKRSSLRPAPRHRNSEHLCRKSSPGLRVGHQRPERSREGHGRPLSTAQVSQSQRSHFCFWVPVRTCSSIYFPVFRGSLVTSSFRAAFGCVGPPRLVSSSGAVAELLPHFVSELVSRECNATGHPHLCVGRRNAQNMRVHCPVTPWSCSAHTTPHEPRTLVDPRMGVSDGSRSREEVSNAPRWEQLGC